MARRGTFPWKTRPAVEQRYFEHYRAWWRRARAAALRYAGDDRNCATRSCSA